MVQQRAWLPTFDVVSVLVLVLTAPSQISARTTFYAHLSVFEYEDVVDPKVDRAQFLSHLSLLRSATTRYDSEAPQLPPSHSTYYPPVLPSQEYVRTQACTHTDTRMHKHHGAPLNGTWFHFRAHVPSNNKTRAIHPLFQPDDLHCYLSLQRPTIDDLRFLQGSIVAFMGDSHIRYLTNYFIDYLKGPCMPKTVYSQDVHLDSCFPASNVCHKQRAEGWSDSQFLVNITTLGGVFPSSASTHSSGNYDDASAQANGTSSRTPTSPDRGGDSPPGAPSTSPLPHSTDGPVTLGVTMRWAPRQMPFNVTLKDGVRDKFPHLTTECIKELSKDERAYLKEELGATCRIAEDVLEEIITSTLGSRPRWGNVTHASPFAVVIGISEITKRAIGSTPKRIREMFTLPNFLRYRSKIIIYNHMALFSEPLRVLAEEFGFRIMDVSGIMTKARFCSRSSSHIGAPAGAVTARLLAWKLRELWKSENLQK